MLHAHCKCHFPAQVYLVERLALHRGYLIRRAKTIYVYSDMKIIFMRDKVSDVQ
jgi:hypothetical protein